MLLIDNPVGSLGATHLNPVLLFGVHACITCIICSIFYSNSNNLLCKVDIINLHKMSHGNIHAINNVGPLIKDTT